MKTLAPLSIVLWLAAGVAAVAGHPLALTIAIVAIAASTASALEPDRPLLPGDR